MQYILAKFDGVGDSDDDVAGIILVPDDVDADAVVKGIEDEFMADMGENWDTVQDYLDERFPTVVHAGFDNYVYV